MENDKARLCLLDDVIVNDPKFNDTLLRISFRFFFQMVLSDMRLSENAKQLFFAMADLVLDSNQRGWFTPQELFERAAQFNITDQQHFDFALKNLIELNIICANVCNEVRTYSIEKILTAYPSTLEDIKAGYDIPRFDLKNRRAYRKRKGKGRHE